MSQQHFSWAFLTVSVFLAACDGASNTGGSAGSTSTTGSGGTAGTAGSGTAGQPQGGTGTGGNATAGSNQGGTGAGGTTSSSGTGGTMDDLAALSDEFDNAATLPNWTLLHQELGLPAPYDTLDINQTEAGKLTIVPTVSAWYQDDMAAFLYKEVTGDFLVEVSAAAYQKGTENAAPTETFNSGGMLLRDPSSTLISQNWLMYNIGHQDSFLGVEGKATVNSQSQLILVPTGTSHEGTLRLCRVGNTVRMLRRLPGETGWVETHTFPGTFTQTPATTLPNTLQVGIIVNAYLVAQVRTEFDYIHFSRVTTLDECSAE
ncbi:MAG: hypothetical protein IPK82_01530 [Polyangiaceae bacterium]|nr:hypothetical protein [Polyangiaceae bacterium]